MYAKDLNSGPHDYTAISLASEQYPQLLKGIFGGVEVEWGWELLGIKCHSVVTQPADNVRSVETECLCPV